MTDPDRIPTGETQCDIWTLARDPLFCDDPPTYIKMPRIMRERWPEYAESVRELCIAAIEKRHTQRQYIRWLEQEIRATGESPEAREINRPSAVVSAVRDLVTRAAVSLDGDRDGGGFETLHDA